MPPITFPRFGLVSVPPDDEGFPVLVGEVRPPEDKGLPVLVGAEGFPEDEFWSSASRVVLSIQLKFQGPRGE